jgi:hypothetical protein
VHPDIPQQQAIAAALAEFVVVPTATPKQALELLQQNPPDLVIAHPKGARRLLRDLDRTAPDAMKLFIANEVPEEQDELLEVAAEGYQFTTLPGKAEPQLLNKTVQHLLMRRSSVRRPALDELRVAFQIGRHPYTGTLGDASCVGLSILLDPGQGLERLLRGCILSDLMVIRRNTIIVRATRGMVRHVSPETAGRLLRVGIQILSETTDDALLLNEPAVRDAVRVVALMMRACRRREAFCIAETDDGQFAPLLKPTMERLDGRYILNGQSDLEASVGDVVELCFDLSGKSFRGFSVVLARSSLGLSLSVPQKLMAQHRRGRLRVRLPESVSSLSFRSPLSGEVVEGAVLDLHAEGLAFLLDSTNMAVPLGMQIPELSLTLPHGRRTFCRAEVRQVRALPGGRYRCGLQLFDLSSSTRKALTETVLLAHSPNVEDAGSVPFSQIWQLVTDSAQSYPNYPARLNEAQLRVLESAHTRMASSEDVIGKGFLARAEGQAAGYSGGLRIYSRTWLIQHLLVPPGFHRQETLSGDLSAVHMDFVENQPDLEFVSMLWRRENRWPERVLAWCYRSLRQTGLSFYRTSHYLRLDGSLSGPTASLLTVRQARSEDLALLEQDQRLRGDLFRMQSEDLSASEVLLPSLSARYAQFGLDRRRQVHVVDGEREPLALLLTEEMTPGLSWPELYNSFSIWLPNPLARGSEEAWLSLLKFAVRMQQDRGLSPVVACEPGSTAPLEAMGFTSHGNVAQVTIHRSIARSWIQAFTGLYERVSRKGDG